MLTRLLPWLYAKLNVGRWIQNPTLERVYLPLFFAYKRFAEDPFAGLTSRRPDLFRGGHILDVGANVGYTAAIFANAADEASRVYAFEPEPLNLRRLHGVVRRKRLEHRITVVESAVGDTVGEVTLVVNDQHPGDHRVAAGAAGPRSIRVPMTTLDTYVVQHGLSPVRFIKIDVQGLELAVSRGMEQVMERNRRLAVAFEYQEASAREWGYDAADLMRFYASRGFDLFVLSQRGELLDASPETVARLHAQRGYVDMLAVREGAG
jgi:FkbM family methyltransferase